MWQKIKQMLKFSGSEETAIDKLDEFLSETDKAGYLTTINPSGYCYIFNIDKAIIARVTTDNKTAQHLLVNKQAPIGDILKFSELLEPYRKEGWFNVSLEDMEYNLETCEVLYGKQAEQYRMLVSLRTPEKDEEIN